MMTSVTLASTSGPIHGAYSAVAASDETTSSETEFETPRPAKRCLTAPLADTFKKRRKQSTPVRISAAENDPPHLEGKPTAPSPSPEPACLYECGVKSEPGEEAPETSSRPELPWMGDLHGKDWLGPHGLPFTAAAVAAAAAAAAATNPIFMAVAPPPPPFSQPEPARQPIRIFNPDAYCELCNKEFCNKYFLKTHKANKHGIYSDPPGCDAAAASVNVPSYTSKQQHPVPSAEVQTQAKPEGKAPLSVLSPFGDIFPNPFPGGKMFGGKAMAKALYDGDNADNSTPASNSSNGLSNGELERNPQDESPPPPPQDDPPSPRNAEIAAFKSEPEHEGVYYAPPGKPSPGQRELDLSSRLRRIGVMNPKAFCEICCKEYCNKYFLRTHKMKRHGIYIPDDRDKDAKAEATAAGLFWSQNAQTSPLNLIMAEQSGGERKTTSPTDISCDVCGIKFQNSSLAQLHSVNVHSGLQGGDPGPADGGGAEEAKPAAGEKSLAADAISEDLQKLQTMILQLNDLDVNRINGTCGSCGKEFENRYYLHAHMMTEHGLLLDDVADADKSNEADGNINNNTMCELCGKDLQGLDEMKRHMLEFHQGGQDVAVAVKKEGDYNGFSTPEKGAAAAARAPTSSERRSSMSLTPTSSYCEICNKELCNKYFMKTHMQRMHGIEIENGAQIGGVICDICNKELCSKYFLRVHKHNTHGIVEYGASLLQPRKGEGDAAPVHHLPAEPDPALKPADLADLSHRYFTHFTEVCTICSRRFRSTKWLKAHLLSDHGQAGAEKWAELEQHLQQTMGQFQKPAKPAQGDRSSPTLKIPNGGQEGQQKVGIQNVLSSIFGADDTNVKTYSCSYCPFSTTLLPLLFVHERSHSHPHQVQPGGDGEAVALKCPICGQTFHQPELLQHHVFTQHPFLPLPPFYNGDTHNEASEEPSDCAEEESARADEEAAAAAKPAKGKKLKRKATRSEPSPESLKDVAKRSQLPATYALPQAQAAEEAAPVAAAAAAAAATANPPGYVMQAFLLEESAQERRIVPSVVFLPVFQKQPAPITVTFTLTPA